MSSRRNGLFFFALVIATAGSATLFAQKVPVEDVVKRHVEQTFPQGAAEQARNVSGACQVRSMGGRGTAEGPFELKSTPETVRFELRLGTQGYEGETMAFDGKSLEVGFAQRRTNTRSAFGSFLSTYALIVNDGLFGGMLNRRWPLRDVPGRDVKLSSDGMKKLDGQELHRLRYRVPRNQGDLTVHLYFDPATFRHVASVYSASRSQDATEDPTAMRSDERFTLMEKFSDFEATSGVPQTWLIHYTRSGERGLEWRYECKVQALTS